MLKKLWLVIKHRSFFRCPFCKGQGGEVSGYYEPEWTECHACYQHYDDLVDHGMDWFCGRLPLLEWIRAKLSIKAGIWYVARLRNIIGCTIGRHEWQDESSIEPGLEICACCYEHRKDGVIPGPDFYE